MLIAEYFCNYAWITMNATIFSRLLRILFYFFVFLFLSNKNIIYLLVKFGKWME